MRAFQILLFVLGVLCLLSSLAFIGGTTGDVLWRAGVAALVADIPCILLWPHPAAGRRE